MRKLIPHLIILAIVGMAAAQSGRLFFGVGKQPDGSFVVATGQRIDPGTIAFQGRPMDIALHPDGALLAVTAQRQLRIYRWAEGEGAFYTVPLEAGCSYRGLVWSADGQRLYASLSNGNVQCFKQDGGRVVVDGRIELAPKNAKLKVVPGGMAITHDGKRLFVANANGGVFEVGVEARRPVTSHTVQNIPFDVKLTEDEKTLVVSNWAGRAPRKEEDEEEAESGPVGIFVDERGIAASGTVSLLNLDTKQRRDVTVGLHPAGLVVAGDRAYVANAASDTVSEIDLQGARVTRTFQIRWEGRSLFGSMPNTLALRGDRLYACNGGDNALCEINLGTGKVEGFRPAGFFPVGVTLSPDGSKAFVVNTKGNGSVRRTAMGEPGNAHDFQGTVSVINLNVDLRQSTDRVADLNGWKQARSVLNPNLAVYKGKIKHVLYIIKENRTYDEVYGDLPQGNGDPKLCGLGEEITPNHRALAQEFTLFDNAYVSGTNSAEGHQWAVEGLANDYIERFYGGYSRSYPYDGGDAMAYSSGGFIWDAAAKKRKSIRIYGEFCQEERAQFEPRPKNWLEAWKDREAGTNRFKVKAGTSVVGMRKFIHPSVICWPLVMSDQWRADEFIKEYEELSKADKVPNLMLLTLPADHTEGTTPGFPKPKSMVADNDLALGRVVEAISKSPQWKETCIFVMEDDAQAGPDHVDGHRTVCLAISPYTRRGFVDSTLYTQISILRSIELMLGLDPMTKFDALATPFSACFTDTPDLRPYAARPNRVKLDDMNPPTRALKGKELYWAKRSMGLDWSGVDTADWYTLNRVVWHSLHGVDAPYPALE
jgi:DNA-binding beta-propeller fold protein YncE